MNLDHQLAEFSPRQQAAFAAALIERMLPNYALYQLSSEQGNLKKLENITSLIWQWVYDHRFSFNAKAQLEKLLVAEVDLATDSSIGAHIAQDCYIAVQSVVQMLAQKDDTAEIVNISRLSQATVALYIEFSENIDDDQAVLAHPLMQYEIALQQDLITTIKATSKLDKQACEHLKAQALAEGMSNIGLSLD